MFPRRGKSGINRSPAHSENLRKKPVAGSHLKSCTLIFQVINSLCTIPIIPFEYGIPRGIRIKILHFKTAFLGAKIVRIALFPKNAQTVERQHPTLTNGIKTVSQPGFTDTGLSYNIRKEFIVDTVARFTRQKKYFPRRHFLIF
jgi:hypothetical protein